MSEDGENELTSEDKRILKYVADAAREEMPTRRGFIQGTTAAAAIGALGFGTGQATAQTQPAAGQVGTENNPVDVEATSVNADEFNNVVYLEEDGDLQTAIDSVVSAFGRMGLVRLKNAGTYEVSTIGSATLKEGSMLDLNGARVHVDVDQDWLTMHGMTQLFGPGTINANVSSTYTSNVVTVSPDSFGDSIRLQNRMRANIIGQPHFRGDNVGGNALAFDLGGNNVYFCRYEIAVIGFDNSVFNDSSGGIRSNTFFIEAKKPKNAFFSVGAGIFESPVYGGLQCDPGVTSHVFDLSPADELGFGGFVWEGHQITDNPTPGGGIRATIYNQIFLDNWNFEPGMVINGFARRSLAGDPATNLDATNWWEGDVILDIDNAGDIYLIYSPRNAGDYTQIGT